MEFSHQEIGRISDNSLYQTLGIQVDDIKEGRARARLKPNPALCWPFEGQPHGGILFTLMDTTMAWAVLTGVDQGLSCATINMDIQFIRRAVGDVFFCDAWVTHQASRMVYARGDILDEANHLLATGQGVFRVVKSKL